ncbi:PREDICTED: ninein-like protein isoform X6 [Crocodylus porosus]|uniref:ninein-like protein isoform X6 n=1 Tax=Crocodylus porosus TaxID=8502 RepID=UPI00093FF9D8|nr:PREDICTED: ninein-like protein isoform X6 [Crocodylus porosus]
MDEEEENKYVSQLKEVYNSCDTTGTGYLDKEELTELCHKLHLERQLPILLQTLLGSDHLARVNFEEFKEGFVTVLSSNIDLGISDEESSYLEPAIPDEIKPKYVNGAKWYGRRTRPELQDTEMETTKYLQEPQVKANGKSQLRRSASLESVESLKSDEEAESAKEPQNEMFEARGQMSSWNPDLFNSPRQTSSPYFDMTENQVRDIWEELGIGDTGYLNKHELAIVCENIGLKLLEKEELEDLFKELDRDGDGRVSFKEFQLGLFTRGPISLPVCSTPVKQPWQWPRCQASEESGHRTAAPSFLTHPESLHLFSSIDDGSGLVSPELIISIWAQEGVENCKEILKSLDFSMEEKMSLSELALAFDNELMVSQSGVQQAAFASFKHELRYLEVQVEQISRERDKMKLDLEKAEKRNLQLVKEVDDHHTAIEHRNENKLKALEQDYRGKLIHIKSEVETEKEQLVQQVTHQQAKLEADIQFLQDEEASLREKLTLAIKELRDKNDELQMELEKLHSQLQEDRHCRSWCRMRDSKAAGQLQPTDETPREKSLQESRQLSATEKNGPLCVSVDPYAVSIEMELMVEQLKEQLQDLKIQLETKGNYYEREIELMKRNFEMERKDTEQSFKIEISELEEQKGDLEKLNAKYQEVIDGLRYQLQKSAGSQDLEKRFEKERSEMEQYYAKEICNLGHRLAQERDKLEEELKMQHKNELQLIRAELHQVLENNALLKNKLGRLQQEVQAAEEASDKHRKLIEELQREKEEAYSSVQELTELNERYKQDISQLNAETCQLSSELSAFHHQNEANHQMIQLLNQRLADVTSQKEDEATVSKRLQEAFAKCEQEHWQQQLVWQRERELLEQDLRSSREKVSQVQELKAELEHMTQERQMLRLTTAQLRKELEESQDQLLEANTRLHLAHSQHLQELQQLKGQMGNVVPKEHLSQLHNRLAKEQQKVQQLQEDFSFQAEQSSRQLAIHQEEHEKMLRVMEERTEGLEQDLRNAEAMLQEKVAQLKEQFDRKAKCDLLLKDLYVENAQLMKALQVTEQRQKSAEKKNFALEEKLLALNQLLRRITPASLCVNWC